MSIAFATNFVAKPERLIAYDAPESLCDPPRAGQRMVDGGDVVVKQVLVGLVQVDALFNNGLIVLMQRDTGGVKDAGTLHAAGLDFKGVVAAVAVRIDPFADGRNRGSTVMLAGKSRPSV